ncbi:MAG: hypothetical protein HGA45_16395, partial [Chloroflexales bacterium]|nr:hypothetical protein [Chloroflexales bacterium]
MATMMEFEQSLDSQLPPELWPQAKPLAELLAGACTGGIADDEIQRRLAGQPGLAPVLRALANKEIRVDGTSLMISMLPTMVAASPTPTLAQDNRVAIIVNKGSAEAITAFNVQQNEYTNVTMTLSGTRVDASAPPLIVRCPTLSPPPEPLTFYDRSEPLDRIAAQLKLRHGVWLAGQPGCGMTSLLEKAANLKPARGFARRDGVVYLDGWLEPRDSDDLAQSLYNRFFMRADGAAVRLQPQATRAALGQMKALFVLDRPRLEREQLIGLARDLASAGSVLVATDDPGAPWLAQLEVAALPQEDARRVLVEAAQLGGSQTETLALADRLCAAL